MIIKCFILRTDYKPELGKNQEVLVLLNAKNELPTANSVEEAKKNLWQNLEFGNVFYEETIKTLSQDWKLVLFSDLQAENCPDYNIIVAGINKAGYLI